MPLMGMHGGWTKRHHRGGARVEQMPEFGIRAAARGRDGYDGCVLEGGTIDAMAEQIVAGADRSATCSRTSARR